MDKHTQVFSTYSVTLYFDDASAAQLRHAAERISLVTGNNYMIQHSVPPHITLGMFHAAENNLQLLKKVFADFADKAAVFSFSGVNSFYDKVIFLYPAEEAAAHFKELNSILHEIFLPLFEAGGNHNYMPCNWYPHTALAVKLNPYQFKKGYKETLRLFEEKTLKRNTMKIASLGLALCKPYTELSKFSI